MNFRFRFAILSAALSLAGKCAIAQQPAVKI